MGRVAGWLFVAAVPLFLVTATITWAVNDLRLYRYGFDKFDASLVTGIEREGLVEAAHRIRGYFNSSHEPLEIRSVVYGEEMDLFNDKEVLHMRDVKRLIWGVYGVGAASAVYIVSFVAVGYFLRRHANREILSRQLLWGAVATVGLVAVVGVAALAGFESLWRNFHELAFANDLWQLNPRTDRLIMMFPEGFWFEATLFVALATVLEAVLLGGLAGGYLLLRRRREQRASEGVTHASVETSQL